MSVQFPTFGAPSLSRSNPWAAVAPLAQLDSGEYKLMPDSCELSAVAPESVAVEEAPAPEGAHHTPSLAAAAATSAAAAVANSSPLMVVLLGSEASSKEGQAEKLASALGLVHLHMGALITEEIASGSALGQKLQDARENGNKSPAVLLHDLVSQRCSQEDVKQHGFVMDAYPQDLNGHKAEDLLKELDGLRLIQLVQSGGGCPATPLGVAESAKNKGVFFEVEDEADQQDTADVLEALVDNFHTAPVRMLAV